MEDRDSNSRSAILHPSSSILHPPFSILSGRDLVLAGLTAFWLGLLTVLSPCPLAMNVTAIAYIGRRVGDARGVLVSGVLYAVGRSVAYVVLAALLVWGLLSAPGVSGLLRTVMPRCLDLLLIVTGMVLLGLVSLGTWNTNTGARLGERISRWNYLGAGLLGAVSALTFCPVSAALFFLSLIPLAGTFESPVFIPLLYGIGGSLPMLALAVILSFGTRSVARAFHRLTQVDWWARRLTGVVFLLLGLSLTLHNIFGVNLG